MADFLASFNFNGPSAAPQEDSRCMGIEDVKARLSELFVGKVSPTRAERIDATIEIGQAAQFSIPQDQHEATEPATGNAESVKVSQLLADQPQNDPVLHTAVSKQLLAALEEIDGSSWVAKDAARQGQGWVFAFECQHSLQQWLRRAKPIKELPIAHFSQKEPDAASGARPAFDCRGRLSISFLQSNSAVTISYGHTPVHRTVSEIYEYSKPAPPPPPAQPETTNGEESAPTKKSRKSEGTKKKRSKAKELDENGNPKKKKRKSTKAGTVSNAELVLVGAAQDGESHGSLASVAQTAHDLSTAAQPGTAPDNQESTVRTTFNVSPEEAARRQATATTKLQAAGVDLATLSADQFSIFSNQSPDVQMDSLNILVKYGAERLRILQPANKDSPATPNRGTPAASQDSMPTQTNGHNGNENSSINGGATQDGQLTIRKLGKSRLVCFNCKSSKTKKCSKERPSCEGCISSGAICEYPPTKPRKRKSAAVVEEDEDAEGEISLVDDNTYKEAEAEAAEAEDESVYPAVPIANLVSASTDGTNNHDVPAYGDPMSPPAMPLPHVDPPNMFQLHPNGPPSSSLALPHDRTYYQPYVSPTAVSVSPYTVNTPAARSASAAEATETSVSSHQAAQKPEHSGRPHPVQERSSNARGSKGHKNRPSGGGGLQFPSSIHATGSPSMEHSAPASTGANDAGPYQGYPELGSQSGPYHTLNDTSSQITYEPYLHHKKKAVEGARNPPPDQQQIARPPNTQQPAGQPPGGRRTPSFGGNHAQSTSASQNSPYMRQNTPQSVHSQLALPSLSQRRQWTHSPSTAHQQPTSYGSYSYPQPHQPNQGATSWYGSNNTNNQATGQHDPNYSWGMPQNGWSRMQ